MGAGNLARACAKIREAIAIDRRNEIARRMESTCEGRAASVLAEAMGLERSDPARARTLYDQVMAMAPRDSEEHRTAYQRKNALARARPMDEDE
jgi:hypothetical protein